MKVLIASVMFFSSVTIEQQVIVSKNSIDAEWVTSISLNNEAFALELFKEQQLN